MIYDLDDVRFSKRIQEAWLAYLPFAMADLKDAFPDLKASEVPDEQFRLLPNGRGELFVKVRNKTLKLAVPQNEFLVLP